MASGPLLAARCRTVRTVSQLGYQPFEVLRHMRVTATGLFVRKTGPVDAAVASSAGQFTADVGLTARFGGTGVAIADQYSVSGTVDNFQGDGVDSNWEVDLNRARFATSLNW